MRTNEDMTFTIFISPKKVPLNPYTDYYTDIASTVLTHREYVRNGIMVCWDFST